MDPSTQGKENPKRDRLVGDREIERPQGSVPGGRQQPVGDREYEEIESRFQPRTLSPAQKEIHNQIMFSTKDLAEFVVRSITNNRERAIALTKLEEFATWCEKGLIHGSSSI